MSHLNGTITIAEIPKDPNDTLIQAINIVMTKEVEKVGIESTKKFIKYDDLSKENKVKFNEYYTWVKTLLD